MGKADEASFDRPGDVRHASRVLDDSGMPSPDRAAWLSRQDSNRCHDIVGCRRIHQGRSRGSLPGEMERRARLEIAQTDIANGRLALQDTGTGPEGIVDTHPGVQSDP